MRAGRSAALPVTQTAQAKPSAAATTGWRGILAALAFTAALVASALPAAPAPPEAEADLAALAGGALTAGQIEMARILAIAALERSPEEPRALSVLAAIGLMTREPEAAREVAGRAFRAAADPTTRFAAARLASRAAFESGHPEIAKYWTRRAYGAAPGEGARRLAIRDFQRLRAASRLRYDLGLSIRPSDNVNQGAEDAMLRVDGRPTWFYFDGATRALPGVEAQISLGARYRLAGSAADPTEAGLRLFYRGVTLSDRARAQAPTARAGDFATAAADVFLARTFTLSEAQSLRGALTLGRIWQGGSHYGDRVQADLALTTAHGADRISRIGFALERQWQAGASPPATAVSLDAGIEQRLASGDSLAFSVDLSRTFSDDANQCNTRMAASLRYARARPVAGMGLQAALGVTARDYPVYFNGAFNDTGRQDLTFSASVDLSLPGLGLMGFEPVLSLEARRTRSNISRYTGQSLGLGLRIQSSF